MLIRRYTFLFQEKHWTCKAFLQTTWITYRNPHLILNTQTCECNVSRTLELMSCCFRGLQRRPRVNLFSVGICPVCLYTHSPLTCVDRVACRAARTLSPSRMVLSLRPPRPMLRGVKKHKAANTKVGPLCFRFLHLCFRRGRLLSSWPLCGQTTGTQVVQWTSCPQAMGWHVVRYKTQNRGRCPYTACPRQGWESWELQTSLDTFAQFYAFKPRQSNGRWFCCR